jgi:hypothetical protein
VPLAEISYDNYDVDEASDNSSDICSAYSKPPVSMRATEFSLNQFAKWMGQANYSAFNKWEKVCVAGFVDKKHQSIIRRLN